MINMISLNFLIHPSFCLYLAQISSDGLKRIQKKLYANPKKLYSNPKQLYTNSKKFYTNPKKLCTSPNKLCIPIQRGYIPIPQRLYIYQSKKVRYQSKKVIYQSKKVVYRVNQRRAILDEKTNYIRPGVITVFFIQYNSMLANLPSIISITFSSHGKLPFWSIYLLYCNLAFKVE